MIKKRLVIANWKGYIESPEEAKKFAVALRKKTRLFPGVEAWIAPSCPLMPAVVDALKSSAVKVGAQSAYLVSALTLKNCGAQFAIVGHSERRSRGETDEEVGTETANAISAGLAPVLCVGESERDPSGAHFSFIEKQLSSALTRLARPNDLVVAYEPIWTIGKSAEDAMKPADAQEMIIFIRKTLAEIIGRKMALRVPILYGGSVEPANAAALITEGGASGFLVGHASARIDSFLEILKLCRR